MICACPIPALVTGTSGTDGDAAAFAGAAPDAAAAGGTAGKGVAVAPPGGGGGGGAGSGGGGVTTNPGTGDVPGGTCNVGGAGGGGCTPTPGVTGSGAMSGGGPPIPRLFCVPIYSGFRSVSVISGARTICGVSSITISVCAIV